MKSKNAIGQIINVGSGAKYNLKKVIKKIINISKGGVANHGKIKLRKDEIIEFYPSISKAKKILNWKPKINFEKGLKRTINYYKSL